MTIRRITTTGIAALIVGALATPLLGPASPGSLVLQSSTSDPARRVVSAPNVFYPVAYGGTVDLKTYPARPGTELKAPCGTVVRAAHAGTVLLSSSKTSGPHRVSVVTSRGKLTSYYGYMQAATVTDRQIVAAGQPIGRVGAQGIARTCSLYFALVTNGGIRLNPTRWLAANVGKPVPQRSLFDNTGMVVASFNTLGASHTPSAKYPGYAIRTDKLVDLFKRKALDVVGVQEFEPRQRDRFVTLVKGAYASYPTQDMPLDSAASVVWRTSTMQFVSGETFATPYFDGKIRQRPIVLLRDKRSGRTAYFISVHNPASVPRYGDQTHWRTEAIKIERAKVVELRKTGRPVFLIGDMNDKAPAFCPLTRGMLMISANSLPAMTCARPAQMQIDWVFGAGPMRFTSYEVDPSTKTDLISDHPIVVTRVHLSE